VGVDLRRALLALRLRRLERLVGRVPVIAGAPRGEPGRKSTPVGKKLNFIIHKCK